MSLTRRASLALLVILLSSCTGPTDLAQESPWPLGDVPPSLSVVPSLPAVCGTSTSTTLIADEVVPVGSVEVTQDGSSLYIAYRTEAGWPIYKTAVFVGSSLDEMPLSGGGNPRVGQFPYKSSHDGPHEVIWQVPMPAAGSDILIATFAQVGAELEGAWGEGEMISPGGNWSMYFTHEASDCAAQTVDETGGTVTTPRSEATLIIGAGALPPTVPVDITIDPATVDDLLDHAAEMGEPSPATSDGLSGSSPARVDPELPTIFGVTPIEGSIWDLGPDGLEFLTPATLVLQYDEADLPPGVAEEDLGVFIINGIFEQLPSTIDTDANTLTAEIGHFTFAFAGSFTGQFLDLEVTKLEGPSADPEAGMPFDVTAEVRNNTVGPSGGGTLLYEAFGVVNLGEQADSCTEVQNPAPADVAVACGLGILDEGAVLSLPTFQIIPLEAGGTLTVRATVTFPEGITDTNPENDQRRLVLSVVDGGGGVGGEVDLHAALHLSAGSEPIIGGVILFTGRVDNLGPDASAGGTLRFSAFGDVVLGDVPSFCAEADFGPGVVGMECDVDPLARFGIDLKGPFRIIAQSAGDVFVKARVISAAEDTDVNPENDEVSRTLPIEATFQVDLEPFEERLIPGLDDRLVFHARGFNWGPHPSNGGTMVYEVDGLNVVLSGLAESCTDAGSPGFLIRVLCPFGPFNGFTFDPIGWLEVIPQSAGLVTFSANMIPTEGDTDVNPDNNRQELVRWIGPLNEADLAVTSLDLGSGDPAVVGTPLVFLSDVQNLGPDTSRGGTLTFTVASGDVVLDQVVGSCTDISTPDTVVVSCDVAPLAVGQTDGNGRFQIVPPSAGNVTVWAQVSSALGDVDLGFSNNFIALTVPVVAPGG